MEGLRPARCVCGWRCWCAAALCELDRVPHACTSGAIQGMLQVLRSVVVSVCEQVHSRRSSIGCTTLPISLPGMPQGACAAARAQERRLRIHRNSGARAADVLRPAVPVRDENNTWGAVGQLWHLS